MNVCGLLGIPVSSSARACYSWCGYESAQQTNVQLASDLSGGNCHSRKSVDFRMVPALLESQHRLLALI